MAYGDEYEDETFDDTDDGDDLSPQELAIFETFLAASGSFEEAIVQYSNWEQAMHENLAGQQEAAAFPDEQVVHDLMRENPDLAADYEEYLPFLEKHEFDPHAALVDYRAAQQQLVDAAEKENVGQPKSFSEAMDSAYADGLLGKKAAPSGPRRGGISDAVDDWMGEQADYNAESRAARAAVREAARNGWNGQWDS